MTVVVLVRRAENLRGSYVPEVASPVVQFGVGEAHLAVNDGGMVWADGCRPLQERQRRQRLIVRRCLAEILVIGIGQHQVGPSLEKETQRVRNGRTLTNVTRTGNGRIVEHFRRSSRIARVRS